MTDSGTMRRSSKKLPPIPDNKVSSLIYAYFDIILVKLGIQSPSSPESKVNGTIEKIDSDEKVNF
jgi:hypothetical protein